MIRRRSGGSRTIGAFDGYIFVVAEYNHSITGVLKNALDQAYKEWIRKPFTAIGYGGTGAVRAGRAPAGDRRRTDRWFRRTRPSTSGARDFMTVHPAFGNKPIEEIEGHLLPSAKTALDELVWWAKATMAAKAAEA